MYQKNGLLYWILDDRGNKIGVPIKASALAPRPTMKNLQSTFEANAQFRPIYKERLTKVIDSFFHVTDHHSRANFCDDLNFNGINPVFRENKDGRVYGITFIDNRKGAVINGSDLGKEYSGQALAKQFACPDRLNNNWAAGEKENQERVDQGLEWPQLERYDHSLVNWIQDIGQELLNLMKAERYHPEPTNPYLKGRKKKKRGLPL